MVDLNEFLASASTPEWRARVARMRHEFTEFCTARGTSYQEASLELALEFGYQLFKDPERELAANTITNCMSALNSARVEDGLPSWTGSARLRRFNMAVRKSRRSGASRNKPSVHFSPGDVLPFLPKGNDVRSVLVRAYFLVRAVALLRPSEPLTILPESVVESPHLNQEVGRVVVFRYISKGSTASGHAADAQYVEFFDGNELFCPARSLLRARTLIEQQERRAGRSAPTCLFLKPNGIAYAPDTLSNWAQRLMERAVGGDWRAHDLRAISNQILQAHGVAAEDIAVRGNWASKISTVRQRHYSYNRFVRVNFAALLLTPLRRSGK